MASNKQNTTSNEIDFEEKVRRAERRQKNITRVVCLILAALMALGGTITVLVTVFS